MTKNIDRLSNEDLYHQEYKLGAVKKKTVDRVIDYIKGTVVVIADNDFRDFKLLYEKLDKFKPGRLIFGWSSYGADKYCASWAKLNNCRTTRYRNPDTNTHPAMKQGIPRTRAVGKTLNMIYNNLDATFLIMGNTYATTQVALKICQDRNLSFFMYPSSCFCNKNL